MSHGSFPRRIVPYLVGTIIFVLDQASKALAVSHLLPLGTGGLHVAGGVVYLRYLENTGAAFGLLRGQGSLLAVLAVLIVGVLVAYYHMLPRRTLLLAVALGGILGGALGNLSDRLRLGYVIDFVDLTYWPVFNLADSAICTGIIILSISLLLVDRRRDHQPARAETVRDRLTGSPHG